MGSRRLLVLALAAVAAAGGTSGAAAKRTAAPAAAAGAELTMLTFNPSADARVEEGNPNGKYGLATRLASDGDVGLRVESVLRFDVDGLAGSVRSAKLRLYAVSDGTADGPAVYPAGEDWTESAVTWATRPQATGPAVADIGAASANSWTEIDVAPLVTGNGGVSILLRQSATDGIQFYSRQGSYRPELIVTVAPDPVVMAAGDIACKPGASVTPTTCHHRQTSELLLGEPELTQVLTIGDNQYEDGLLTEFLGDGAYDGTWGRLKAITRPTPGNHEYHTPGAPGYFDYFGAAAGEAGKGYYSFDLGSWHLVALNSEITSAAALEQERWLRADLATMRQPCILAYWHTPLFSSGNHGGTSRVRPLWDALYEANADVVLNAHDHDYERFAAQDPSGQADANGIMQFIVGTGGGSLTPFTTIERNSEARNASTFGVIKLTLHPSSFGWQFVPEVAGTFSDSGSAACHDSPPKAVLAVTPTSGSAPVEVTADASASTDDDGTPIDTYTFDFGDGSPALGPQREATSTHVYTEAGTYTVAVTIIDTAGLSSTTTAQVDVRPNANLVGNSGFEDGTSGWNTSGSSFGVALTTVSAAHTGRSAGRLSATGPGPSTCVLNDSPNWVTTTTTTGAYTGALWVRADTPGAVLKLRLREWSGGTLVGSARTVVTLTTEWQRVSVTYAAIEPGSSTLDYTAYVLETPPGTCFYADDAAITFRDSPPKGAVTVTPSAGRAPVAVTADASASTDNGSSPIESYAFDFGDGSPIVGPQSEPTAAHVYTSGGVFTITVTVTDTSGQSATATAPVTVTPNLIANPSFEFDTTGWNTSGSGADVALTRAAGAYAGEWAAQLVNTTTARRTCVLNDAPNSVTATRAGTYSASIWARGETAGATLKLRFREWSGRTAVGTAVSSIGLTTAWQQVSVLYTPASPGASTLDLTAYVLDAQPGTCFYADAASIYLD